MGKKSIKFEGVLNIYKKNRLDRGVSQEYYAQLLGVSLTSVSRWESSSPSRRRRPRMSILLLMTLPTETLIKAHQNSFEEGLVDGYGNRWK